MDGVKVEEIIILKIISSYCLKSCKNLYTTLGPLTLGIEKNTAKGPLATLVTLVTAST